MTETRGENDQKICQMKESELSPRLKKIKRILPNLSFLLFFLAIFSLVYFPSDLFASNSYMSESALQPGVAENKYPTVLYERSVELTLQYIEYLKEYKEDSNITISEWRSNWIKNEMEKINLDIVYQHRFSLPLRNEMEGVNTVGILQTARNSGRETIVLNVPSFHPEMINHSYKKPVDSMCFAITMMEYLRTVTWLSKDVVLLVTDSEFGDESVRAWLDNYHDFRSQGATNYHYHEAVFSLYYPSLLNSPKSLYPTDNLIRSGSIRAALALDFFTEDFSYVVICPEGINGKLPNLDVINAIDRVAMYSENVHTTLNDEKDPLVHYLFNNDDGLLKDVGLTPPHMALITFALHNAIGEPTGNHGWFLQYNIDAITLKLHSSSRLYGQSAPKVEFIKFARVIEGIMHSFSNLIEHFHQSFYYYLLSNTFRYISIGEYMKTFGVIVASIAGNLIAPLIGENDISIIGMRSFIRMILFQISGLLAFVVLKITLIFGAVVNAIILLVIALFTFFIVRKVDKKFVNKFYSVKEQKDAFSNEFLKTCVYNFVTIIPCGLFITASSLLNFPFSLCSIIPLGIIIMLFRPTYNSRRKNIIRSLLIILVSLPALLLYTGPHFNFFGYHILDSFNRYGTLTFPFLTLIYFPFTLSFVVYGVFNK